MRKLQSRLTIALLFTALALIAFFVTAYVSAPIDFLYRNTAGLGSVRNIALIVALLGLAILFIAGLIVSVLLALQPARLPGKVGKVLPLYLLLFLLVAIVSALIGLGQVGNLFNLQGVGSVTFIAAWLALAAVLSIVAIVIAAARANLSPSTVKSATRTAVAASGVTTVAAVAMLASVVLVSTSQPARFGGPGGGGQFPGGDNGGNRPGAAGQNFPGQNGGNQPNGQGGGTGQGQGPEATGEPQSGAAGGQNAGASGQTGQGQRPEATGEPPVGTPNGQSAGFAPAGQGQRPEATGEPQSGGGFPGGQNGGAPPEGFPPGGGPGGPGGGFGNLAGRYTGGGILMAVFAIIGLIGGIGGLTALRQVPTTAWASPIQPNYPREAGLALVRAIGITIVVFAVIQLVPVTHDNPPVKTPINWDSDQTKQLATSTCLDCHSNETRWPAYSYVAPMSWLTTMHVHDARQQMNLSEMDSMPAFQRRMLAENMANQIRMGSMPPKDYLILHPDARLTEAEKQELIDGLQKSLSGS